jgi:hypothetical protein
MKRYLAPFIALCPPLTGCECTPYEPPKNDSPFRQGLADYVMVVVLDLSGSYERLMLDDGKAWKALTSMVRKFYKERMGENDKLIIAQISAVPVAPLWEGSPKAFGKSFPTGDAFRQFLKAKSNPNGSRVHDSITDAIDYALPLVSGSGRAGLFIFSDMDDNLSKPGSEERLVKAMGAFGQKNGAVGIYWCDMPLTPRWRGNVQRAGVRHWVVESEINAEPQLPSPE